VRGFSRAQPLSDKRTGVISEVCEAILPRRLCLLHQLELQRSLNPATDSILVAPERFGRISQEAR
jgi:hypothetical protein